MSRAMAADETDVARRLTATPGVQRVPNKALDLFVMRDFLDAERCAALCHAIDERRRPSDIADHDGAAGFRTSETCDLDLSNPIVAEVDAMLCDLLGLAWAKSEPIQGQRYAPGQEFKPHTDSFNPGGAEWDTFCAVPGQRTWTLMVYLNEPGAGGDTCFLATGELHRPEVGKLMAQSQTLSSASLPAMAG